MEQKKGAEEEKKLTKREEKKQAAEEKKKEEEEKKKEEEKLADKKSECGGTWSRIAKTSYEMKEQGRIMNKYCKTASANISIFKKTLTCTDGFKEGMSEADAGKEVGNIESVVGQEKSGFINRCVETRMKREP